MLRNDETTQFVGAATPSRHPRFRRWAKRRARQLRIVALILAATLVIGACGVMLRRATSLIGLPDVGDPFNVAAFRAIRVPEEQDAFALFRRAADKLRAMPVVPLAAQRAGRTVAWSQADPDLRKWLLANREAFGLFQQGAFQADGNAPALVHPLQSSLTDRNLGSFVWLAFLDASRLEEQGNMPAAWDAYRAILRTKTHITRKGTVFDRYFAGLFCRGLDARIAAWAANPKTDVLSIRRALDEVRANEPKPEWDVLSLKIDYLQMMSMLDRPDGWAQQETDYDEIIRIAGEPLRPNLAPLAYAARRFLDNEPERSRRVLRLAYANWLAHAQDQDRAKRKPSVRAVFGLRNRATYLSLYGAGAVAPAASRALSPHDLARWLITTRDARALLFQWPWPVIRISEQREHRALVVLLAEELYHRERGSLPPSEEALIGAYLDHLPEDGSSELDDGTAERIDDSESSVFARSE
jgi:hypothetical protein